MAPSLSGWQLCTGQKGGQRVRLTRKGKGTKWMVVTEGNGLPLAVLLDSAQNAEIQLAQETLGLKNW